MAHAPRRMPSQEKEHRSHGYAQGVEHWLFRLSTQRSLLEANSPSVYQDGVHLNARFQYLRQLIPLFTHPLSFALRGPRCLGMRTSTPSTLDYARIGCAWLAFKGWVMGGIYLFMAHWSLLLGKARTKAHVTRDLVLSCMVCSIARLVESTCILIVTDFRFWLRALYLLVHRKDSRGVSCYNLGVQIDDHQSFLRRFAHLPIFTLHCYSCI